MGGQVRTLEIAKGGSQFQFRQYIETGMADVHRRIRKDNYLRNLDVDTFARKAGKIIGDVNYAHPFREGSGRTQLEYLRHWRSGRDTRSTPEKIGRDPWIAASKAAHQADYAPMAAIIREQVIAERNRGNQRVAQQHPRVIDAVIDNTLADQPDAAARLRREAGSTLDAKLKDGETIEPPRLRTRVDGPGKSPSPVDLRTKATKRPRPTANGKTAMRDRGRQPVRFGDVERCQQELSGVAGRHVDRAFRAPQIGRHYAA